MVQAKQGDWVQVHYTGKLTNGEVFDTSEGGDPLEFNVGTRQVIPGFDNGVVGMEVGETKTLQIPVDQAYGPHRQEMVLELERDKFPDNFEPQVGQQLQLQQADGHVFIALVVALSDSAVTLDANHPLAGMDLVFEVQLVGVSSEPKMPNAFCGCDNCGTDNCGSGGCGSGGCG